MKDNSVKKGIFLLLAALCFTPWVDPPIALLMGIIASQSIGHPFQKYNSLATKYLLQFSVVGLGFGMNIYEAAKAGQEGLLFTVLSIVITMVLGLMIGRLLSIGKNTSLLISSGTAICGGSAIAAVSPVIDAKEEEMSVSLGTVFILNSLALFIFPTIGHYFNMSQHQFGIWSAIAIHDTSSVVGAAQKFGEEALKTATTVKLERALWIIPLTITISIVSGKNNKKIKWPYFIFFFIIAMAINTFFPAFESTGKYIVMIAKKGLTLTLFLIGAGITKKSLQNVGVKPFILGVALWIIVSTSTLFFSLNL